MTVVQSVAGGGASVARPLRSAQFYKEQLHKLCTVSFCTRSVFGGNGQRRLCVVIFYKPGWRVVSFLSAARFLVTVEVLNFLSLTVEWLVAMLLQCKRIEVVLR